MDNNIDQIKEAFSSLMGMSGDYFVEEILKTGVLSRSSYDIICDNISYNGENSVVKYFGLVHWYYLKGTKA